VPAAYPLHIRSILRASKSRTQPAAFRLAEPRRGYGYAQATGTDTPVFWDVQFRFTSDEAIVFQLWFREIINRGVDEFTMPIRTEFGVLTHTCRFLPDSLLPADEAGDTWGYRASIMARAPVIPAGYTEAAELITTLPDWRQWSELLDQTATAEMPTA
jgi:hypothetical protein